MNIPSRIAASWDVLRAALDRVPTGSIAYVDTFRGWLAGSARGVSVHVAEVLDGSLLVRFFRECPTLELPIADANARVLARLLSSENTHRDPKTFARSIERICSLFVLMQGYEQCPHCQVDLEAWTDGTSLFDVCGLGHWVVDDELEVRCEPEGLRPARRAEIQSTRGDVRFVWCVDDA